MITKLKELWMRAFGDSRESVDAFFETAYDSAHSAVLCLENQPVSALYWLDYRWGNEKLAYIYAVATDEAFRGQGYGRKLMNTAHETLQKQGYAGAVLVPAQTHLVSWYEKQGYRTFYFGKKQEISAGVPLEISQISGEEYQNLRKKIKPAAPQPGKELYDYFATYGGFYQAEKCLFAAALQGETVYFQEFLGTQELLPGAVASLGAQRGIVTLPDEKTPFAMLYRFRNGPVPDYFSFPLD